MELEVTDNETGEVVTKWEDVFLGDFPLMTPTGTFIINGAERVIVSQIVRSPGAYFKIENEEKTGNDTYLGELIPSRGTWLEFMSDGKKAALGNILNMSVDRKRKILSTVLYKTIGLSLNLEEGEDGFTTAGFEKFLNSMGLEVNTDLVVEGEQREFLNLYMLLYTAFFGNYEEISNTLQADKIKTTNEALISIYENQRSDEVPTIDGSVNLMNAKFFDKKRYDLTKAGRYKLNKKLSIIERMEKNTVAEDIFKADGTLLYPAGTRITKVEREVLKQELSKGSHTQAFPFNYLFSHPDTAMVDSSLKAALTGRILAEDIDLDDLTIEAGTVLTDKEISLLSEAVDEVPVYVSIIARKVSLNKDNVSSVLNYGQRLFVLGRLTENSEDVKSDDEYIVERYAVDSRIARLTSDEEQAIIDMANEEEQLTYG